MFNYEDALNYVEKCIAYGRKVNNQKILKLMEYLGGIQDKLKIIHIAGTNGKGSTASMLRNILTQANYKVGLFSSPHLISINERFSIDGKCILDADFAKHIEIVKNVMEILYDKDLLSFFELMTVVAFSYFYEEKVDIAIIEVGIGGRLDSTNIIKNPILSIITSISFDHMNYLGHTIEEISSEKAGIIKKNCPIVLYSQCNKVYNVIKEKSEENNSLLYYESNYIISVIKNDLNGITFNVESHLFKYDNIILNLIGNFQINNACNVIMAVKALKDIGLTINDEAIYSGLLKTTWNGRMEVINQKPLTVLDGAHNIDAANVLSDSLKHYFVDKQIILVIAVLADKEYKEIINILSDCATKIIITKADDTQRSLEPSKLYNCIINKNKTIITEKKIEYALDTANKLACIDINNNIICCCGSLHLIGNIRKILTEVSK